MTSSEYATKEAELFTQHNIPMELRSALSYQAYEKGHAYGYGEVYIMLQDLVDALEKPLQELQKRLTEQAEKLRQATFNLKSATVKLIDDITAYIDHDDYDLPNVYDAVMAVVEVSKLGV
jgi:hypothetical protein